MGGVPVQPGPRQHNTGTRPRVLAKEAGLGCPLEVCETRLCRRSVLRPQTRVENLGASRNAHNEGASTGMCSIPHYLDELDASNMARGIIVVYFEPKPEATAKLAKSWAQSLQSTIPDINWVRKVVATDQETPANPYRLQLLVDVSDIAVINESQLVALQPSSVSSADYIVYTQISKDLQKDVSDDEYPPPGTELIQVGMDPTSESVQDYHDWFNKSHLGHLQAVPGWRSGSRYSLLATYGPGREEFQDFMSANEYEKDNGLGGPIWRKSIDSEWSKKVLANLKRPIHRRAWKFAPLE